MKALSNKVCIVGVDESDEIGTLPGKSMLSLHLEATHNAIRDAGLKVTDIDGVFTAGQHSPATIAEALGVIPRYVDGTTVGGCSFIIMVGHAMLALHHGLCDVAVVSHGESGRSGVGVTPRRDTAIPGQYERPLRLRRCADLLRPHHHATHARVRHHARAVGAGRRLHAQVGGAQPQGQNRDPITVKDVLDSRPGHLAVQRAEHLPGHRRRRRGGAHPRRPGEATRAKKPIYVRGAGEGAEHVSLTQMRNLTFSEATRVSGEKAFGMAGVGPRDFDHVMLYDAFTSGPPLMLEALGLAKRGEGVNFFEEGRSTPGGTLPINTNGGGLSYTHSGMYGIFPIIESVRQLRGECGPRQVPTCQARAGQRHGRDAVGGRNAGARERTLDRGTSADPREHSGAASSCAARR